MSTKRNSIRQFLKRDSLTLPSFIPSDYTFTNVLEALDRLPDLRTDSHLKVLRAYTSHFKVFAEMTDSIHTACCRAMRYQHCGQGTVSAMQVVFNVGDQGSKMYVILAGSCAVLCPKRVNAELYQMAVLRPGECFGELALRNSKPRAFSVLAREDTHMISLDRQDYHQAFGISQENSIEEKIAFLKKNPVFALWTQSAVRRLSYFFQEKGYIRKQVVFKAGMEVTEVLLVKGGELELTQAVSLPRKRDIFHQEEKAHCEVEVMLEREGELLGAYEVLMQLKHRYSCHCSSTQAAVLAISREDFEDLLEDERFTASLKAVAKVKEAYRLGRLSLASELARKERMTPDTHPKSPHEADLRVQTALKAKLVQHSVNLTKPRLSFPPATPLHRSIQSLDFLPTFSDNPHVSLSQKTWTDLMTAKFLTEKPLGSRSKHTRTVVNFHTQRQRDIKRQNNTRISSPVNINTRKTRRSM